MEPNQIKLNLGMALNHLVVRLLSWDFKECECSFIAITPRSTLPWSGSTHHGLIDQSNKSILSFTLLETI